MMMTNFLETNFLYYLLLILVITFFIYIYFKLSFYKLWSKEGFKWNRAFILLFSFISLVFLSVIFYLIYCHDHFIGSSLGKGLTFRSWEIEDFREFTIVWIFYFLVLFLIGVYLQCLIWGKKNFFRIETEPNECRIWYSYLVFLYFMGLAPCCILALLISDHYDSLPSLFLLWFINGWIDTSTWNRVFKDFRRGLINRPYYPKDSKKRASDHFSYKGLRIFYLIGYIKSKGLGAYLLRHLILKIALNWYWVPNFLVKSYYSKLGFFMYFSYQIFTYYIFLLLFYFILTRYRSLFWISWGYCLNKRRIRFIVVYFFLLHQLVFIFFPFLLMICLVINFNDKGEWKLRESMDIFEDYFYKYFLFHFLKIEPVWTTWKEGRVKEEISYFMIFINFILMCIEVWKEEKEAYEKGKPAYEEALRKMYEQRKEERRVYIETKKSSVYKILNILNKFFQGKLVKPLNKFINFLGNSFISLVFKFKRFLRFICLKRGIDSERLNFEFFIIFWVFCHLFVLYIMTLKRAAEASFLIAICLLLLCLRLLYKDWNWFFNIYLGGIDGIRKSWRNRKKSKDDKDKKI